MGRLIYGALTSLDGYVVDADGHFDWAAPDEQVHQAVNDLLRRTGTQLYGRAMYDVLVAWETMDVGPDQPAVIRDFARIWQQADKVVYSTTLDTVGSARTRIERTFDPAAVRALKDASDHDLSIGGPGLAGQALRAGLVDELHLFVHPVVVGGGTSWLPDGVRLDLTLAGERRFDGGVVQLHYRPRGV
jgi:dihydrofolate reductase